MVVISCDPEDGKIVLEMDEEALPEPPPKRPPPSQSPGGKGGARSRGQSRRPRDWGHEGATQLEDMREGDVLEGVVTNVSPAGVFVDVGAVRDARLSIPARFGRRFRIGDVVQDCTIESIDLDQGRMA